MSIGCSQKTWNLGAGGRGDLKSGVKIFYFHFEQFFMLSTARFPMSKMKAILVPYCETMESIKGKNTACSSTPLVAGIHMYSLYIHSHVFLFNFLL